MITTLIVVAGEPIVHITAQHSAARPRNHAEHAQRVLVVVLVTRAALAASQHAAAAATSSKVLRVCRPRGAGEVAALLHQVASTARNAAGVPGLRSPAFAIRTVRVLVSNCATNVMA